MLHRKIIAVLRRVGMFMAMLMVMSGCVTPVMEDYGYDVPSSDPILLAPGDELEISFFGASELNLTQKIRRDGRISLPILGEVTAGGSSVEKLKATLTARYTPHLQIREITIIVRSHPPVYVSGAVRTPGRIEMQRPISAIEAVMEAGGFDMDSADLKRVLVIRHTDAGRREYRLDLGAVLAGKGGQSFYLKPNDIVHVPKRMPWF